MQRRNCISILLLTFAFLVPMLLPLSATPCADPIGSCPSDEVCLELDGELAADTNLPGIVLDTDNLSTDYWVTLGFNPELLADGTSWGGGSDFTWTFNALLDNDPTMTFSKYLTTHTGSFVVDTSFSDDASHFAANVALVCSPACRPGLRCDNPLC